MSNLEAIENEMTMDDLRNYCAKNPYKLEFLINLFRQGQTKRDREYTIALITSTTPVNLLPELNIKILSYIGVRNFASAVSKGDFFNGNKFKIEAIRKRLPLKECGFSTAETALEFIENKKINNFTHADFSDFDLEDKFLEKLAESQVKGMIKLTSLNLRGCKRITNTGLAHLKRMPLTHLNLSLCELIKCAGLAHLGEMPLIQLNLAYCYKIRDAGLSHLKKMALTELILYNCVRITDAGLKHLTGMPLIKLVFFDCSITDAGLAHISKMPLVHLNLSGCDEITDAGLKHLLRIPLAELHIRNCFRITNAGLTHLEKLPLTRLSIYGTNIKENDLSPLFARILYC